MNLVVGATGFLGGEICRRLSAAGEPVRAMTRAGSDPSRVAALHQLVAGVVQGDLKNPSSLSAACRGVRTVISTATTVISRRPADSIETTDRDGQKRLVDAAAASGVNSFIYVSVPPSLPADLPLIGAKRAVEEHLRESGLDYTILQPTAFMEVWLDAPAGWDAPNGRARIVGEGNVAQSWISLGDVAEFAVQCVDSPKARKRDLELGGPEAVTPDEALRIFEEEAGRSFEVERIPFSAVEGQLGAATDPYEHSFLSLMLNLASQPTIVEMDETASEFGVSLTSVRDHVRRALGAAEGRPREG